MEQPKYKRGDRVAFHEHVYGDQMQRAIIMRDPAPDDYSKFREEWAYHVQNLDKPLHTRLAWEGELTPLSE